MVRKSIGDMAQIEKLAVTAEAQCSHLVCYSIAKVQTAKPASIEAIQYMHLVCCSIDLIERVRTAKLVVMEAKRCTHQSSHAVVLGSVAR